MVPHSGTPVRTHRLRPLNQPRRVHVEVNARNLPIAVIELSSRGSVPSGVSPGAEPVARPFASSPGETSTCPEPQSLGEPLTPSVSPASGTRREVESIGEIWRVDDEWWRQSINRRYIEVVMKGGKHVVLYQDLNNDEWFEQSI